jgi:hypothetical protein
MTSDQLRRRNSARSEYGHSTSSLRIHPVLPSPGDHCLLLAMDERDMRATLRADHHEGQAQQ